MKRTRRERPGGRPRRRRRECLKCGRGMSMAEKGYHQRIWFCRKCLMWYGYLDGVLTGVTGRGHEWWMLNGRGEWHMAEGMLVVYGGTRDEGEEEGVGGGMAEEAG